MNSIIEKAKADAQLIFAQEEAKGYKVSRAMRFALKELIDGRPLTARFVTLRALMSRGMISDIGCGFLVNPVGYAVINPIDYSKKTIADFEGIVKATLTTEYRTDYKAYKCSVLVYALRALADLGVKQCPFYLRELAGLYLNRSCVKVVTLLKASDII